MGPLGWPRVAAAAVFCLAASCSSSDEDPAPPAEPNVSPVSVSVVTPAADVQAAHRLDVRLQLSSATALEGVGVAFRAFPQAAYDAHAADIESWVLGSTALDLPRGGGTFDVELLVPYEVPAGAYYVVPEVDPLDLVEETDEEDQLGPKAPLSVAITHRDHPRLMIDEAVLDVPAFELSWALGASPDPLGLTVAVRAEANAPVLNSRLTACVSSKSTPCLDLPLGIWDTAAGLHVPALVLPELLPGEPTSVHLDLAFDEELSTVFDTLVSNMATACLANVPACVDTYGPNLTCAEACVAPVLADPARADTLELQRCLLQCVPFTVHVELDAPDTVLFEPASASPGRTTAATLQLLAPPPVNPELPAELEIWPLQEPVFLPDDTFLGWIWDPVSVEFGADRGNCADPVLWSARLAPDQPAGGYTSAGTIIGTDYVATYWPPLPSDPDLLTTKVVVEATACGETASRLVTLVGRSPSVKLDPAAVEVVVGQGGTVDLKATVTECPVDPQLAWAVEANDARLTAGPGTLEPTADPLAVRYHPPAALAYGPPVTVTVRATAQAALCPAQGTSAISVGLARELKFEKAYVKEFSNSLFGAGVDLYAGAFLDRGGGRADAHARVPVKVFGAGFDLLNVTDHASVDPRPGGEAHFIHKIDTFGFTVHTMNCPGDDGCSGTAELWSDSKCKPEGPPPMCVGATYETPCTKSATCPAGLRCMDHVCTKKCDGAGDCPNGLCLGSLAPGPYKKVFVIVVVPVTVEGKVCADYGIEASLNLLEPIEDRFSVEVGPFFELGGYASAAVGYTGLLAVGVRGELVLVRDDFTGTVAADILLVEPGELCPYDAGCIMGRLTESVENDLQGGKGKVYLFADYPTLRWCTWYPCFGTAQARATLASWGSLFQVANTCDWCTTSAQCAPGVSCVDSKCDDGFPGLLCKEQHVFVSAE